MNTLIRIRCLPTLYQSKCTRTFLYTIIFFGLPKYGALSQPLQFKKQWKFYLSQLLACQAQNWNNTNSNFDKLLPDGKELILLNVMKTLFALVIFTLAARCSVPSTLKMMFSWSPGWIWGTAIGQKMLHRLGQNFGNGLMRIDYYFHVAKLISLYGYKLRF